MIRFDIKQGTWLIGDTFEGIATLPDQSVDMVLADLPYGTTRCAWDTVLPLEPLWREYWRVCRGPVVLTASQPFTSALVMSQSRRFRYSWVWDKALPVGHLNAKRQPLRVVEDVLVFYATAGCYHPQKTSGHKRKVARSKYEKTRDGSHVYGQEKRDTTYDSDERYPTNLIRFSNGDQTRKIHPTQKPVALFEYLIRTYTNPGDTVLDNTAGSGTTAVAAERSGRRWVCIERDVDYSMAALDRIHNEPVVTS